MQKTVSASIVFTGKEWLQNHSITIKNGTIAEVKPSKDRIGFKGCMIVPAFIDAQVYGAGSKLFSLFPEAITLRLMHEVFLHRGTVLFQPTVATNTMAIIKKCIDAVREYWSMGGQGVHGLHVEGPWINPARKGAHLEELIHPPTTEEVDALLEYGQGVISMITLAPEICDPKIIEKLRSHEIVVSAGHSNSNYNQAMEAFDRDINTVTHLFNAMSPFNHREPGLPGAVFHHKTVHASIIPDGYHVHFATVALASRQLGERLFAITDAVTETIEGPYQHKLAGDKYECNGVLSGSALSMYTAFLNLVQKAGIDITEALKMCSLYPAKVMGCNNHYGMIAPGYTGQLLVLDEHCGFVQLVT